MNILSLIFNKWVKIIILSFFVLAVGFRCTTESKKPETMHEKIPEPAANIKKSDKEILLERYNNLENDYIQTIQEIEKVVSDENINLAILKENLKQILESIKEEKSKIDSANNINSIKYGALKKAKQLDELLAMSKEVLAERLIEMKEKDTKLTIDNRKIYYKLEKTISAYEEEKLRNAQLKEELVQVKENINLLEKENNKNRSNLRTLMRTKLSLEQEIKENNNIIAVRHNQIQELSEILGKVYIDCYYIYEKGNPVEKIKIFLTSKGLSEKHTQYFIRKKPDIYVEFKIPDDLFSVGIRNIRLKFYNSLNTEIYNTRKIVNAQTVKIIIPNKNFLPGNYSIVIFAGNENIVFNDRYKLKISQ